MAPLRTARARKPRRKVSTPPLPASPQAASATPASVSPYFTPITPKADEVSRTPSRVGGTVAVVLSPYFPRPPPVPRVDANTASPRRGTTPDDIPVHVSPLTSAACTAAAEHAVPRRPRKRRAPAQSTLPAAVDATASAEELDENEPWNPWWDLCLRVQRAKPVLIQEELRDNPWALLVAVMLLNKTAGRAAIPVLRVLLTRWPTPVLLAAADVSELTDLLRPLGLQNMRAQRLVNLSQAYLDDPPNPRITRRSRVQGGYSPTPISHLPGVGRYALDSYRMFCTEEWRAVHPEDKELRKYMVRRALSTRVLRGSWSGQRWKWAAACGRKWDAVRGLRGNASDAYLERVAAGC